LPSVATYPLLIDRKSMQSHQTLIDLLLFLLLLCRFHRHRKSTHSNEVLKIAIGDFQELFRPGLHSITTSLTYSNKFSEPSQTLIHAIAIDDQSPPLHATAAATIQNASDDGDGNNPPERYQKMEHLQSQKQHTHIGTYSILAYNSETKFSLPATVS
jgi:hypothetical protein